MTPKEAIAVKNNAWISLLGGIRPYKREWLSSDILAGITLAALAIPEVMGYTKIAGTPVITGLYTILFPIAAFAIFGSSRHLVVGADSATAAIMYAGIAVLGISGLQPDTSQWAALAALSALLAAAFLLLARIARLGFLADFLSRTVLVGFLTGVGIQVAMGQVGGMLGIPSPHVELGRWSGDTLKLLLTLKEIEKTSLPTLAVSVSVLAVLLFFGQITKRIPAGLVAVIGAIVLSQAINLSSHGVSILGPVPSGLPTLGLPEGLTWTEVANLLPIAGAMFFVILAQSAATSRAYAVKYNERADENTNLIGLGLANIAAGLSSAFVVNGSPTKTEMVDEAKSHTQVAQLTTAAVVLMVLLFLTKPLQYLPNAALAAIVFLIGIKLIDLPQMRSIWKLRRDEFVVALLTAAIVVTIGVEQGIVVAIALSLILHVGHSYHPVNAILQWDSQGHQRSLPPAPGTETEPGLIVYRYGSGLFYANAPHFAEEVMALIGGTDGPTKWIVLDAAGIDDIDYTGGKTLAELASHLHDRSVVLAISDANETVRDELEKYGVLTQLGDARVFDTTQEAINAFHAPIG
jgi:high affinity sulfate transporter 1